MKGERSPPPRRLVWAVVLPTQLGAAELIDVGLVGANWRNHWFFTANYPKAR
jgi:hypothetical protein